jgi:hypothetical protein
VFFHSARHGGAPLVGEMDAELHFVSMGRQCQPAAFQAQWLPEKTACAQQRSNSNLLTLSLSQNLITT